MSNLSTPRATALAAIAAACMSGGALAAESRGALYGDLRLSLDYADDNSTASGPTYTVTDNNSVWGVKASTAQGGVTVFGAYERFIDSDDPSTGTPVEFTRQAYLGLTSFCGTVKFGRHSTAYADAGRKLDPFYNTAASGTGGVAAAGSIFGAGNSHGSSTRFNGDFLGEAIVADHIAYQTPVFLGLTANAAMFLDETGNADQDHDYGAGLEYAGGGFTAGAQFLDANGANFATWGVDVEAMRAYAGYAGSRFGAGASWERLDMPTGTDNASFLMVSAWYGVREDTRVAVSFGLENESGTEGDSLRAGVFHDVAENFTIWLAVRRYNERVAANPDADVVTLGGSYKFNLGFTQ
jgi:hypothetical protein